MVAKMKYISITGHIGSMNHVVNRYLHRYHIQLEQGGVKGLTEPFTTQNPYTESLKKAEFFTEIVGKPGPLNWPMSASDAVNLLEECFIAYENRDENLRKLEEQLALNEEYAKVIKNFIDSNLDMGAIKNFAFTHYKFGRLSLINYKQYEKFLMDDERIHFVITKRDENHIWGAYFTPIINKDAIDAAFASLGFHVHDIINEFPFSIEDLSGTPNEILKYLKIKNAEIRDTVGSLTQICLNHITGSKERLALACAKVKSLYAAFDVKKHASLSKNRRIFTFSGWMQAKDALMLEEEMLHDDLAVFTQFGDDENKPPTILKNPPIIRQFEFFTRLYGLPQYGEVDPTPILAMTYTLLFGLMFGDVGHGFVLWLLGFFVHYKLKKPLGGIMMVVGVSAVVFGFLYGSIFGYEDIINALWIRPAADIGQTLIFAALLGVGLIILSMGFFMFNSFKQRRFGDLLFGANGVAGFIFYGTVLLIAARVLVFGLPITGLVLLIVVLPLIFVALKPVFVGIINGQQIITNGGVGQFLFTLVVELFETLLSYATNTISFVRVGAFAIIHAGMMHVVLQLSQGTAGMGIFIVIIGNVLVMGIEGLLVGIQVLRLDFYELFSRFYTGGGKVFISSKLGGRY